MKIYLDIDGVLLTKQGQAAEYLVEFLDFVTQNYDCYWLTTHCKGDASTALEYLKNKVPVEALELLKKLKPTNWETWKTEGLDFSQDFLWLDDYAFEAEKNMLAKNNATQNLIIINLESNPEQLSDIIKTFRHSAESQNVSKL